MPKLKPFVLDTETRGNKKLLDVFAQNIKIDARIKDPDKIEVAREKKMDEARKQMAIDADYNEIICIGVKIIGEKPIIFTKLEKFVEWLWADVENEDPQFVRNGSTRKNYEREMITFNGKEFDLPVMVKTAIKADMENFPYARFRNMMDRYKSKGLHTDMMHELGMAWGKHKSLDTYLQIYLGIEKTPIDFNTATIPEIKKHCREDVDNTSKLYEKFKYWLCD